MLLIFTLAISLYHPIPQISTETEILSDISSIQIRASFGPGTASTFYEVSMDTALLVTNPQDFTSFVTTVEQCSCNATFIINELPFSE